MVSLAHTRPAPRARAFGWATLAGALASLIAVEIWLAAGSGLWLDELFSLWATDPSVSPGESLRRLHSDSNPPFYFYMLRLVRSLVSDPHAAIVTVNALVLAATAAFVARISRQADASALALFGIAAFAASGPTYYYLQEGRAYFTGNCLSFAVAWQAALMVWRPDARRHLPATALLGAAAALTHVFAGLFAGCLAFGLVAYGVLGRRRDLVVPGLVLGGSATVVFGLWVSTALGRTQNIGWIEFNLASVVEAVWYVRELTIGPSLMLLPLLVLFGAAFRHRATRPITTLFAITGAAFVALPLLISLHTPLVLGRYWQIGAPMLVVLLIFAARAFLAERSRSGLAAGTLAAAFLLATAATGAVAANLFLTLKPIWEGAPVVERLARDCPAGSVRVLDFGNGYAISSHLPQSLFTEVPSTGSAGLPRVPGRCPVIAWAEHVRKGDTFTLDAPVSGLLALMELDPATAPVRVLRHKSGFVILGPEAEGLRSSGDVRRAD